MVPVKPSRTCYVHVEQNARKFSREKTAQEFSLDLPPLSTMQMTRSVSGGSRDTRTAFQSFVMPREY